jgi:hypothetical protein
MTAAIARLDSTLADLIAIHGGVRPVEQGEGTELWTNLVEISDRWSEVSRLRYQLWQAAKSVGFSRAEWESMSALPPRGL